MQGPPKSLKALSANLAMNDAAKIAFMKVFASEYFARPFGTMPKNELDFLVFSALVEANQIDPNGAIFSIASALQITPAKARSLQMQYYLRANVSDRELTSMLADVFEKTRPTIDQSSVRFGIEQTYLRAALEAKIKEQRIYADISGDLLRVPKDHFGDVMASLLDPDRKEQFEAALRKSGVNVTDAAGFFSVLQREFLDSLRGRAVGAAADKVWDAIHKIYSGEVDYGALIDSFRGTLGG
jgi:hypothetical protein